MFQIFRIYCIYYTLALYISLLLSQFFCILFYIIDSTRLFLVTLYIDASLFECLRSLGTSLAQEGNQDEDYYSLYGRVIFHRIQKINCGPQVALSDGMLKHHLN